MWCKETIQSSYDRTIYTSFPEAKSGEEINKLISGKLFDRKDVSATVPMHVEKNCTILVDLNQLKCRDDIKIDAWTWLNSKTYVKSSSHEEGPFTLREDDIKKYRFITRSFINKELGLRKRIFAKYKPMITAKSRNPEKQYSEADNIVAIRYEFDHEEKYLPPSSKKRVYPSVRKELKEELKISKRPKKALHQVKKNHGGIGKIKTTREIPSVKLAYNIQTQLLSAEKEDDPLLKIIEKQKEGGSAIRKIIHNPHSFDVVLFNDRIIHNIANFCCVEDGRFKSPLCWDITFELLGNPPSYVLVITYQFTTLLHKVSKTCPTFLGPISICHKKDEATIKVMCDALLEACPGLALNLKVLGADGENSILHQTCHAFSAALLLICLKHIKDNISSEVPDGKKKKVMQWLTDVVDAENMEEFDKALSNINNIDTLK